MLPNTPGLLSSPHLDPQLKAISLAPALSLLSVSPPPYFLSATLYCVAYERTILPEFASVFQQYPVSSIQDELWKLHVEQN